MQLPGGLYRQDGIVERDWELRPLNGHLELALWDALRGSRSKVDCVTQAIASAIRLPSERDAEIGAAELSVADRQFLLAQLACHLGASRFWISADCPSCGEKFDVPVDLADLPIKPAGQGYPFAEAEISTGAVKLRAPTGTDQAAIQSIADERQAMEVLVRRCIVRQIGHEPVEQAFSDDDMNAIDEALQGVASEVASAVASVCPNCGTENSTPFDLSAFVLSSLKDPLEDVHDIAAAYHWSEGEILALPRERRHQYLALIDQRHGAHR